MTSQDLLRFTNAMQRLALVFSRNLVPELIEEYREALEAYDIGRIEAACESIRHEEKFFPKPVMITEYIRGVPLDESTLIGEREWTPDEHYASILCGRYASLCLRRGEKGNIPDMHKFVRDHWHDDKPAHVSDEPITPRSS